MLPTVNICCRKPHRMVIECLKSLLQTELKTGHFGAIYPMCRQIGWVVSWDVSEFNISQFCLQKSYTKPHCMVIECLKSLLQTELKTDHFRTIYPMGRQIGWVVSWDMSEFKARLSCIKKSLIFDSNLLFHFQSSNIFLWIPCLWVAIDDFGIRIQRFKIWTYDLRI